MPLARHGRQPEHSVVLDMTCRRCGFVRPSSMEKTEATICPRCLERSGGALSIRLEMSASSAEQSRWRDPLARLLLRRRGVMEITPPSILAEPSGALQAERGAEDDPTLEARGE